MRIDDDFSPEANNKIQKSSDNISKNFINTAIPVLFTLTSINWAYYNFIQKKSKCKENHEFKS